MLGFYISQQIGKKVKTRIQKVLTANSYDWINTHVKTLGYFNQNMKRRDCKNQVSQNDLFKKKAQPVHQKLKLVNTI